MTKEHRLLELRRQRDLLRAPEFRTSLQSRRDTLSLVVPLLNFNEVYYANAVPIADVLGRSGFSPSFYDQAHAQIDSIVSQAINELERGLTPAPADAPLVPTTKLTDEHGVVVVLASLLMARPMVAGHQACACGGYHFRSWLLPWSRELLRAGLAAMAPRSNAVTFGAVRRSDLRVTPSLAL
jgi:hypothetical protein